MGGRSAHTFGSLAGDDETEDTRDQQEHLPGRRELPAEARDNTPPVLS